MIYRTSCFGLSGLLMTLVWSWNRLLAWWKRHQVDRCWCIQLTLDGMIGLDKEKVGCSWWFGRRLRLFRNCLWMRFVSSSHLSCSRSQNKTKWLNQLFESFSGHSNKIRRNWQEDQMDSRQRGLYRNSACLAWWRYLCMLKHKSGLSINTFLSDRDLISSHLNSQKCRWSLKTVYLAMTESELWWLLRWSFLSVCSHNSCIIDSI